MVHKSNDNKTLVVVIVVRIIDNMHYQSVELKLLGLSSLDVLLAFFWD